MQIPASLHALWFVLSLLIIVCLVLQLNENVARSKETRVRDQERITKSARLILEAATSAHPLFNLTHAIEAKWIIDDVIELNGGIVNTEKNLSLPRGKLEEVRAQIYEQVKSNETEWMDKIVEFNPVYDTRLLNDMAGFNVRKRIRGDSSHSNRGHIPHRGHTHHRKEV